MAALILIICVHQRPKKIQFPKGSSFSATQALGSIGSSGSEDGPAGAGNMFGYLVGRT